MTTLIVVVLLLAALVVYAVAWVSRDTCASCWHFNGKHHYCNRDEKYCGGHHSCPNHKPWAPTP